MIDSKTLTYKINTQPNPEEAEYKIWQKVRYLVAQESAAADFDETTDGYYQGRHVIPGPKANKKLTSVLRDSDWNVIKHQFFIRFTDSMTTDSADERVGRALYGIMSDKEADEYEEYLKNASTRIHSKAT